MTWAKAVIPILDRGFLYGDSYYEVVITQDQQPVFMQDHLERGRLSALMMDMDMAQSDEFLIKGHSINRLQYTVFILCILIIDYKI